MEDVAPMPFVSVVMPNWNGKEDTLECLDSLRNLNYPKDRMEIIIVDNGSKDGSPESIKEKFSEMKQDGFFSLKLIELPENIGAPAAINRGIKSAHPDYDYIFKIDNDVVFDIESLKELVKTAEKDERVGIAGSTIFYYKSNIVWLTGGNLNLWFMKGRYKHINKHLDLIGNEKIEYVDDLPGCALLIKNKLIEKIGYFDEIYFVYTDDTDFCIRSRKADFINAYNPHTKIWHKVAATTKKITGFSVYYTTRNRIVFERKHARIFQLIFYIFYTFSYKYPIEFLRFYTTNGSIGDAFLKGIKSGYLTSIELKKVETND